MTGSRPKLLKLVALKRQKAEQSLAIVQTELRDLGKQLDALQEEFASADQAGGDVHAMMSYNTDPNRRPRTSLKMSVPLKTERRRWYGHAVDFGKRQHLWLQVNEPYV